MFNRRLASIAFALFLCFYTATASRRINRGSFGSSCYGDNDRFYFFGRKGRQFERSSKKQEKEDKKRKERARHGGNIFSKKRSQKYGKISKSVGLMIKELFFEEEIVTYRRVIPFKNEDKDNVAQIVQISVYVLIGLGILYCFLLKKQIDEQNKKKMNQ